MHVDIGKVLHVLAHELRTPSGIAVGYLRMLLEDRLTDPADRRRALEQARQALARVSELTHESSALANWIEADRPDVTAIAVSAFIDRVVAGAAVEPAPDVVVDPAIAGFRIATVDADALVAAVGSFVKATARELSARACTISLRLHEHRMLELLIGSPDQVSSLAAGPDAADAEALELERGGLGLSLITAAVVLEAHHAIGWTAKGSRATVGIRLPLEERAHQ